MSQESDKRRASRFVVRRPVTATGPDGLDVVGVTRDVNAQGVFFFTATPLTQGSQVEIFLTLPPGHIFSDYVSIKGTGTVVRVEQKEDDTALGVAVTFNEVEISHSAANAEARAK